MGNVGTAWPARPTGGDVINGRTGGFGMFGDGIHDDTLAVSNFFQAATAQSQSNLRLTGAYLPTGNYLVTKLPGFPNDNSFHTYVWLWGDGPGHTTITFSNNNALFTTADCIVFRAPSPSLAYVNITNGATKGSTTVWVDSLTGLSLNLPVMIRRTNSATDTLVNTNGYTANSPCTECGGNDANHAFKEITRITAISGNMLTLSQPLVFDFTNYTPQLTPYFMGSNNWISDLTVTRINPANTANGSNIKFQNMAECGASNVESSWCQGQHFQINFTLNFQGDALLMHDGGTALSGQDYAFWVFGPNSWGLVQNSIWYNVRHGFITEGGGSGMVCGYNFSTNVIAGENPTTFLSGDEENHGAHAAYNLYEGNVTTKARGSYVLGSSSHEFHFREAYFPRVYLPPASYYSPSWPGGFIINQGGFMAMENETWQKSNSFVACVTSPTLALNTNGVSFGSLWFTNANTVSSNYANNQTFVLAGGFLSPGSQNTIVDTTVIPSTYYHCNWDPYNNAEVFDPNNPDHSPDNSFYLASKPSWWTPGLAWPSIGADLSPMIAFNPAYLTFQQMASTVTLYAPVTNP